MIEISLTYIINLKTLNLFMIENKGKKNPITTYSA
jgi:hypothetical protein